MGDEGTAGGLQVSDRGGEVRRGSDRGQWCGVRWGGRAVLEQPGEATDESWQSEPEADGLPPQEDAEVCQATLEGGGLPWLRF